MSSVDVTGLRVEVASVGIERTTESLDKLTAAATRAEAKAKTLRTASDQSTQSNNTASTAMEKMLAQMQKQVDLLGANTSQRNAYNAALKNASSLEQSMAAMLGAEVDAYKRLQREHAEAITMMKRMEAEKKALAKQTADLAAAERKADAEMRALNAVGYRAQEYKKLKDAQAEVIRMNKLLEAAMNARKLQEQGRDIEAVRHKWQQYAKDQADAIRMNRQFDASVNRRKLQEQNQQLMEHNHNAKLYAQAQAEAIRMNREFDRAADRTTRTLHAQNAAMAEAHALARGLSGSLGALWVTYGNIAGMAIGLAIGSSLKNIVVVGSDVEHTLESIRVLGEATTKDIDKMSTALYDLGTGVHGPRDVAQAFSVLTLAGLSAKDALMSVESALNLSLMGGVSIEKASEVLVQVATAMGFTADGFDRIADVVAKTAAVSVASVDSISGAFKSASATGELFGASLTDMGVAIASIANLGIKGTAAGTAFKNFYTDLTKESKKATETLKAMRLSFSDLKDSEGSFLPLVTLVKKLDDGMKNLSIKQQKMAPLNLFGERGVRQASALFADFHKATDELDEKNEKYANKLVMMQDKINTSYAFSTLGAIAMAQTSQSQMKSVANTMETTLVRAFTSISPQISEVARGLKAAFSSPEMLNGLKTLATGVADVVNFLVEHGKAVVALVGAYATWKIVSITAALLSYAGQVVATTLVVNTMTGSLTLAAGAATRFRTALGPIAIAVGLITTAWYTYKDAKEDATKDTSTVKSLEEQVEAIKKADVRIQEILERKRSGMSEEEYQNKKQLEAEKAALRAGVKAAEESLKASEESIKKKIAGLSILEKKQLEVAKTGGKITAAEAKDLVANAGRPFSASKIEDILVAQARYVAQQQRTKAAIDASAIATQNLIDRHRELALLNEAEAKKARKREGGTGVIGEEEGGAKAAKDALKGRLEELESALKVTRKQYEQEKKNLESTYKQGKIGDIKFAEDMLVAETTFANKSIGFIETEKAALVGLKNTKERIAELDGRIEVFRTQIDAAREARTNSRAEAETSAAKEIAKAETARYEAAGEHLKAFLSTFAANHAKRVAIVKDNLKQKLSAEERATQETLLLTLQEEEAAGIAHAKNKDAVAAFNSEADYTRNILKGVKTDTESLGLEEMYDAATKASQQYSTSVKSLKIQLPSITESESRNEAMAKLTNLAETQRKLWVGVGESISKSLESAFGKAGKAAGELILISVKSSQTEEKLKEERLAALEALQQQHTVIMGEDTRAIVAAELNILYADKEAKARTKAYGDMTGAAKGFFKEGSAGYKILSTAEQAFRTMELVGALKSFAIKMGLISGETTAQIGSDVAVAASDTVTTGVATGNALTRALASGQAAIANALSYLPPPFNFAAAGAVAAALAALGLKIAFSGGSSITTSSERQSRQGTGSVLGDTDAKSESIANSLAILEKNSGLGLVQGNTMIGHLRTVADGISGLTQTLSRIPGVTGKTQMGSEAFSSPAVRLTGTIAGGVGGAALGTYIGMGMAAIGGPLGMALGAAIGSLLGGGFLGKTLASIFGGSKSVNDTGFTMGRTTVGAARQSGVSASQFTEIKTSGGWFRSDRVNTELKALGAETNAQLSLVINGISGSIKGAADILGINGDEFNSRLDGFVIDMGKISLKDMKAEEAQAALSAVFGEMSDRMALTAIEGLDKFRKAGEGGFETLARVTNDVMQVRDVFAVLGQPFNALGLDAITLAEDIISASGGLDKFTAGAKFMMENFATDAQKMTPIVNSVKTAFDKLGISGITTREEFYTLAASQDLTKQASRELYASLMDIAPAFLEASNYADRLADGTTILSKAQQKQLDIDNKRKELEIMLLEAEGKKVEALTLRRKSEIDALNKLDASLGQLQDRVNMASDLSAAAKDLEDVNQKVRDQIATLENAALSLQDQRKRELEGLDKSTLALKERLFALQDEATTKKATEDAAKKAAEDAATAAKKAEDDAKEAASKAMEVAKTRSSLEIEILRLTGKAAEALAAERRLELSEMDSSLVPLKERIYRLTDEAEALLKATELSKARAGLEIEIMRLTGRAAEALVLERTMEIESLDVTLRPLKERIYALQDEAVATTKAAELAKTKAGMDIEILKLLGFAEAALATERASELDGLDASLVPLQYRIYALRDEAAATAKAAEVAKTKAGLDIEVLKLLGFAEAALATERAIELANTDASLIPLRFRIYALQDEATATAKANDLSKARSGLEIEIMKLAGLSHDALVAERAIEIAALDASLRPLKRYIYALQDAAEVTAKAEEAAAKATEVAKTKATMDIEVMKLLGKSAEALLAERKIELATLDSSLVPLKLYIYSLQAASEAAAIAAENVKTRAAMENEAYRLTGRTAIAVAREREAELAALDASLRPLKAYIFLLQDAAEAAAKATEIAKTKASFDIEVMKLTGKAAEAVAAERAIELATLDASLRPLKQYIYSLQDASVKTTEAAAKATEVANAKASMEIEGLKLIGRYTEALAAERAIELAALDASLVPMKKFIWLLQDTAEAAAKASEITKEKASLNIEIMKLEGKAYEALLAERAIELSALDDSLKPLKLYIYSLQDAAEATAKAAEVANTRASLNIEIMKLEGKSAQAVAAERKIELDATDASLRSLKLYAWSLQDAADIAAKAAEVNSTKTGFEIEILKLTGKASQALAAERAIELAALDTSLVPLKQRIYLLQDEAEAEAKRVEIAKQRHSLDIELLEAQGKSVEAIARKREDEIMALDESLRAIKRAIFATQDLAAEQERLASIAKQQRSLDIQLLEALGKSEEALAAKRVDELDALDESLRATQRAIYAAQDAAKATEAAKEAETKRSDAITEARDNLRDVYERESGVLQETISKTKDYIASLKTLRDNLMLGDKSILDPLGKYREAKRQLEASTPENFSSAAETFLEASQGYYASTEAYAADFNLVQDMIAKGIADGTRQLDIAQTQLAKLDAQVSGLATINKSVMSVQEAVAALANALKVPSSMQAPASATQTATSSMVHPPTPSTPQGVFVDDAILNPGRLGSGWAELVAGTSQKTPGQYYEFATGKDIPDIQAYKAINGSHRDGLDDVPFDGYVAELHKGEQVRTANATSKDDSERAELIALNKKLLEKLNAISDNTKATVNASVASAGMMSEKMDVLASKSDALKRKVAVA